MLFDVTVASALIAGIWAFCLVMLAVISRRLVGTGSRALCTVLEGLAVSARRNLPMAVALRLLSDDCPRRFRSSLDMAAGRAADGEPLGEALTSFGARIPSAYTTAIAACERHGGLADVLDGLAAQQQAKAAANHHALTIAAYPLMVATVGAFLMSGIMVFIVPKFEMMFEEMEVPLPVLSQLLVDGSRLVGSEPQLLMLLVFAALSAAAAVYTTLVYRWPLAALAKPVDYLLLAVPGLRRYLIYTGVTHFAQSLCVALDAGAPLHVALWASADIDLAYPLRKRIAEAATRVEQGEKLAPILDEVGLFPDTFVWLTRLGEEGGDLPASCARIVEVFQSRCEQMLRYAVALMFPLGIVTIAAMEAVVIVGLFMPLVYLIESIA